MSQSLDKIIIGFLFGFSILGIYQLSFQLLMMLKLLPAGIYRYLLPQESMGMNSRVIKRIGMGSSILAASLGLFATPWFLSTYFPNFNESIELVQIMSLSVIPNTAVAIRSAELLGKERSREVLFGSLISVATLISGIILIGSALGSIGLAIAVTLSQFTQAIFLLTRRIHLKHHDNSLTFPSIQPPGWEKSNCASQNA